MKTITNITFLLFTLMFMLSRESYSQSTSVKKENISTNNQETSLTVHDLEVNGINTELISIQINPSDLVKLRNFDFSKYREYYNSREIQIENGPKIVLYSIEKMILLGQNFDESFVNNKKNVDDSNVVHPIIPVVNIGFGKVSATELH